MTSLGAEVIDNTDIPSAVDGSLWECMNNAKLAVVRMDFKEGLGRYLRETARNGGVASIEDVIE